VTSFSVVTDDVVEVDASVDGGRVLVEPIVLPAALGWELKAEGLCRDDVCVPVRDRTTIVVGDRVDLVGAAAALGRRSVVDVDAGLVAIALPSESRRQAIAGSAAPSFTLPDLDGMDHSLEEWVADKKLLVAFSSW
jgi:hypothetical protein